MIIAGLNVRGLGKPQNKLALRKIIRKHKIYCLILQETKVDCKIHSIIQEIWGNRKCAWSLVSSEGASGGLISIWNEEVLLLEDVLLDQRVLAVSLNLIGNVR